MTQAAILAASGSPGTTTGFKNRIINGNMIIDQRNAGASITYNQGTYAVDRWYSATNLTGKATGQQNAGSVTPPAGFTNYLGITSTSAYSVGASEYYSIGQTIEGYNIADLGWGTANAKTVTLSFWVRSSITGQFGGAIQSGTAARCYPFSYTINSANTWEQKSITIAGDTTAGGFGTTNNAGLLVFLTLACGSTYSGTPGSWSSSVYISATGSQSVLATNGATFYFTGVQFEVGTTATNFDYRSYTNELQLCQRYFEMSFDVGTAPANSSNSTSLATYNGATGTVAGNNSLYGGPVRFAVQKRAQPTIAAYGNNSGYWGYLSSSGSSSITWSPNTVLFTNTGQGSFSVLQNVTNNVYYTIFGHWTASAEL